ncbi:MAG: LOG family protein [Holosporales bacterium]|jgi:uncharacterized protein (TIGR00730 family)|nr:LOG family protein [Holosporales bacterium]
MSNGLELTLGAQAFAADINIANVILNKDERFVAIFGANAISENQFYYQKAVDLAKVLASAGLSIMTGGGHGIMEAGNKGAKGISNSYGLQVNAIHRERENSPYLDPEGVFMFNTLSIRLLTLISRASVIVFFPGGFGTLEEMFSLLVRIKNGLMKAVPIYLFGSEFWNGLFFWLRDFVKKEGAIDKEHLDIFKIEDDIDKIAQATVSYCLSNVESK